MDILTATRLAVLRRCPRQHYLRYELGMARTRPDSAMLFGSAFHAGLAARHRCADQESAISAAVEVLQRAEGWLDDSGLCIDRQVVAQLLAGYYWRYEADDIQTIDVERAYRVPLVSPFTGRRSRSFVLAGRIDAIVRLSDGRLALMEHKTSGEDIGPDSEYWLRLRRDPQILQYVLAARATGYDVATVLYDVTRKPAIAPLKATPPDKRKYTKDGRLYAAQRECDETPEEYGARLIADIGERPDYYFQRREVPILEDDLADFRVELWQQAEYLRDARRARRWFRNVHRTTCGMCEFRDPCLAGTVFSENHVPAGFHRLANIHPELEAIDEQVRKDSAVSGDDTSAATASAADAVVTADGDDACACGGAGTTTG